MKAAPVVLAGKYRLTAVIGRGGMGTVWRAEHLGFDAPVAVKLIDPKIIASAGAGALQRFQNEARAAAALRSPHVVQVLDYGVDEATGSPFIAMELLEGENLAHRLGRVGKLSPGDTANLVTQLSRAVGRAHEMGIVHRDLKPANIFLIRNEDEEIAKVLDFGTARLAPREGANHVDVTTQAGVLIGTPRYMSPEQISGQVVDHRTDLWALGVIATECLTGAPLFAAKEIGPLVLEICTYPLAVPSQGAPVPAGFDAWFSRAVSRDPALRFPSARALAEELQRVCLAAPPVPVGAIEESREPPPTHSSLRTTEGLAATDASAVAPAPYTAQLLDSRPSVLEPVVRSTGAFARQGARRRSEKVPLALGLAAVIGGIAAILLVTGRAPHPEHAPQPGTAQHLGEALGEAPSSASPSSSSSSSPSSSSPSSRPALADQRAPTVAPASPPPHLVSPPDVASSTSTSHKGKHAGKRAPHLAGPGAAPPGVAPKSPSSIPLGELLDQRH